MLEMAEEIVLERLKPKGGRGGCRDQYAGKHNKNAEAHRRSDQLDLHDALHRASALAICGVTA